MRGGHYVAYVRRQGVWLRHIQTWKLAHAFSVDFNVYSLPLSSFVSPVERPNLESRAELFYHIASCASPSNTGTHGNNSRFLCSVVEGPPTGPRSGTARCPIRCNTTFFSLCFRFSSDKSARLFFYTPFPWASTAFIRSSS